MADIKKSGRDIVVSKNKLGKHPNLVDLEEQSKEVPDESQLAEADNQQIVQKEESAVRRKPFPFNLPQLFELVLAQNNQAYALFHDQKNDYVLEIGSREMDLRIRMVAEEEGKMIRKSDIAEINEYLQAWTELHGKAVDVFYRVCPIEGGIELDVGDDAHTRIRITAGNVEVI